MPAVPGPRRAGAPALVTVGVLYALVAGTTEPFTWPANVLTALPIVALVALAVARWPRRPRVAHPPGAHPVRPWVVLLVLVAAWELIEYAARGPRRAHPTLSSMADALDRHWLLKAVVFFGWLCLGAAIVVAGRAGGAGSVPPPSPEAPGDPGDPAGPTGPGGTGARP